MLTALTHPTLFGAIWSVRLYVRSEFPFKAMAIVITHSAWTRTVVGCLLCICSTLPIQAASQESSATREPLQPNNDREDQKREPYFGPIAHRLQEVILSDDSRLQLPQTRLNLDQALHVPDWL